MSDKNTRDQFVKKIKLQIEMNNYGFQLDGNKLLSPLPLDYELTLDNIFEKIRAINELFIRLNLYVITGKSSTNGRLSSF